MEANKKNVTSDPIPKVEDPMVYYEKNQNQTQVENDAEWDSMPEVLKKILEKGIEESNQGLGISHEEMMARVKEKFPFINGI